MKSKIILISILSILFISVISALFLDRFDGDISSSGNITFVGNENITKNLTINKYLNILSAYLNISGGGVFDTVGDKTYNSLYQNGGTIITPISNFFDSDANSYTMYNCQGVCGASNNGNLIIYFNITSPNNTTRMFWNDSLINIGCPNTGGTDNCYYEFGLYNYTSSGYDVITHYDYGYTRGDSDITFNITVPNNYQKNNLMKAYVKVYLFYDNPAQNSSVKYGFNPILTLSGLNLIYTTNSSLKIETSQVWNYTGSYSGVNTTSDFSSSINSYLSNCTADLSGNCVIPFIFHSDSAGILNYNLSINYTEKPQVTLVFPLNNSVSGINKTFICNSSNNLYALTNITLYLWNSSNVLINTTMKSVTGLTNQSSFNYTFPSSGNYYWNCGGINNISESSMASQNNSLIVDVTNPIINLNKPNDHGWLAYNNNIQFNCSVTGSNIDTIFFYNNFNGTYLLNGTLPYIGETYTFTRNVQDGSYLWSCGVNKTSGEHIDAQQNNFTVGIDTIYPTVMISSITNTNLNIFINSQEVDTNLSTCFFNLTSSSGSPINSAYFTCNSQIATSIPAYGNYTINITAFDLAGNSGYYGIANFSVSASQIVVPQGGGGGGGGYVIPQGETGWEMSVGEGQEKYDVGVPRGSSRQLSLDFKNSGESSREITLSCQNVEGSGCQYVTFKEVKFNLPLIKDTIIKKYFTITLPADATSSDYTFNIIATDDLSRTGSISVVLTAQSNYSLLSKLISRTSSGFPYFAIFLPVLIICLVIFSRVYKNMPLRPIWVIATSLIISFIPIAVF